MVIFLNFEKIFKNIDTFEIKKKKLHCDASGPLVLEPRCIAPPAPPVVTALFAVEVKVRKVATKLQNVSSSAGSLLRSYITQFFVGTSTHIIEIKFYKKLAHSI